MPHMDPQPDASPSTKTVRIGLETHTKFMDWAQANDMTADAALRHLLGMSTVRVPVSAIQRERWKQAAAAAGVGIPEFVKMRVEAALQYGTDPGTMRQIWERLGRIASQSTDR